MIYASSAATYGSLSAPQIVGNEKPENPYGYSKLLMDQIASRFVHENPNMTIVGLRFFNVYGPREFYKAKTSSMIIQLGHQILNNKSPRLFENSNLILRDFVYIEDVVQAKAAAKAGADVVAVIRTTGQSLLDFVPYGPTTEGFGGTYATQENFSIMRKALDEVGEELGRYIMLVNYASGLCMPEIAAMGALERLDMMLNAILNIQSSKISQYDASVMIGEKLAHDYIPQCREPNN